MMVFIYIGGIFLFCGGIMVYGGIAAGPENLDKVKPLLFGGLTLMIIGLLISCCYENSKIENSNQTSGIVEVEKKSINIDTKKLL